MFCVEIEVDDTGAISVGVCPPENENEPKGHLNPVMNLNDALDKARQLLEAQQAGKAPSPQEDVLNEMGFAQ